MAVLPFVEASFLLGQKRALADSFGSGYDLKRTKPHVRATLEAVRFLKPHANFFGGGLLDETTYIL